MRRSTLSAGALAIALVFAGVACSDDDSVDEEIDEIQEEIDTVVTEVEEELEDTDLDPGEGTGLPGDDDDEGTDTTGG
jgi:hypothetical protein